MQFGTLSSRERFHEILRGIIVDRKKLSELTKDEFSTLLLDSFWDSCIRRVLYGEMKWDIGTFFKNGYYLDGAPGERDSIDRDGADITSEGEWSDPQTDDEEGGGDQDGDTEGESWSKSPVQDDLIRILRGQPFVLADGTTVSQELFPNLPKQIHSILVANNAGLIRHAIRRFSGMSEYSEEVVEGGIMGFLQALSKYDPDSCKTGLSNYAYWSIRKGAKTALSEERGGDTGGEYQAILVLIRIVLDDWEDNAGEWHISGQAKELIERIRKRLEDRIQLSEDRPHSKSFLAKLIEGDVLPLANCTEEHSLVTLMLSPETISDETLSEILPKYGALFGTLSSVFSKTIRAWNGSWEAFPTLKDIGVKTFRERFAFFLRSLGENETVLEHRLISLLSFLIDRVSAGGEGVMSDQEDTDEKLWQDAYAAILDREIRPEREGELGFVMKTHKKLGLSILEKIMAVAFSDSYMTIGEFRQLLREYERTNGISGVEDRFNIDYLSFFDFKNKSEPNWYEAHDSETLDAMNQQMLAEQILGVSTAYVSKHFKAFKERFDECYQDTGYEYRVHHVPSRSKHTREDNKKEWKREQWEAELRKQENLGLE